MMQWIKLILVAATIGLVGVMLRHRRSAGARASTRVLAVSLAATAVVSVIYPDVTIWAAEKVGVTRGSDQVLYILVVVFAFTAVSVYFNVQETNARIEALSRALAIDQAVRTAGSASIFPEPPVRADPRMGDDPQLDREECGNG